MISLFDTLNMASEHAHILSQFRKNWFFLWFTRISNDHDSAQARLVNKKLRLTQISKTGRNFSNSMTRTKFADDSSTDKHLIARRNATFTSCSSSTANARSRDVYTLRSSAFRAASKDSKQTTNGKQ